MPTLLLPENTAQRLNSRLIAADSGCLEWSGTRSGGYGYMRVAGKVRLTKREDPMP